MLARSVKRADDRRVRDLVRHFDALHLAAALRDNGGGRLITTEFEPSKVARARENLTAGGLIDLVELREGDALKTLKTSISPRRSTSLLLDGARRSIPRS